MGQSGPGAEPDHISPDYNRKFMNCPDCRSHDVRRTRRSGIMQLLWSLLGRWPWLCEACGKRFALPFRRVPSRSM